MTTESEKDCPFCKIAAAHAPYSPTSPPPPNDLSPSNTTPPSYLVLSTPLLVAFLDLLPLTRGHVLVAPRSHRPLISDCRGDEAAALGRALPLLSRALRSVLGVSDWNVVQNNGPGAAQVVPHVHFHLIPRPALPGTTTAAAAGGHIEGLARSFLMFGRGSREELTEEEGEELAAMLREGVKEVFLEESDDAAESKL